MNDKIFLVVTSVNNSNDLFEKLADGCIKNQWKFILIGDKSGPEDISIEGCDFYNLNSQKNLNFKYSKKCPVNKYSRKNIGYLLAISNGATVIVETDDDNIPTDSFWKRRHLNHNTTFFDNSGWVNIYNFFSDKNIWPRGFALDELKQNTPDYETLNIKSVDCPIQQNLVNENPDVDAIYRLTLELPVFFEKKRSVVLGKNAQSPFNSQNTTWWPDVYKLMYLPSFCSFRMTDIWRSFVAQRILRENNGHILFNEPSMKQMRNRHDLMEDFSDEVFGYLNTKKIMNALNNLNLKSGNNNINNNLVLCYEKLIEMSVVDDKELELLEAWLFDLSELG